VHKKTEACGGEGEEMSLYYKEEAIIDSTNLLISILVRYPEIAKIKYDPECDLIKFAFMLQTELTAEEFANFKIKLLRNLEAMNILEGKQPKLVAVMEDEYAGITVIEVNRDVATLTQQEIALVIELFRAQFKNVLIRENAENFLEEDLALQEEFIKNTLESIKETTQHRNLIAFREEGRVFVFNK